MEEVLYQDDLMRVIAPPPIPESANIAEFVEHFEEVVERTFLRQKESEPISIQARELKQIKKQIGVLSSAVLQLSGTLQKLELKQKSSKKWYQYLMLWK